MAESTPREHNKRMKRTVLTVLHEMQDLAKEIKNSNRALSDSIQRKQLALKDERIKYHNTRELTEVRDGFCLFNLYSYYFFHVYMQLSGLKHNSTIMTSKTSRVDSNFFNLNSSNLSKSLFLLSIIL